MKFVWLISKNRCSKKKKKAKEINVTILNMITNTNEAKAMAKHTPCDCKWNFGCIVCNSNQKWNNETCQCERKNYCKC